MVASYQAIIYSGYLMKKALKAHRRADGRRALLLYLRPGLIKRLKVAALEEDRPAYELAENAVSEWLAGRRQRAKPRKMKSAPGQWAGSQPVDRAAPS
jgi:hypothetical protein